LASVGIICILGVIARGWIGHRVGGGGVRIIIGEIAVAGGLEGGNFGLCGGGGAMTANGARSTEGEACEDTDDGNDSEEFDEGERGMGAIFVLVERWKCGCSHSDDPNFLSEISKGKKQLVYIGGVAGGDLDHRASCGVGLAGDQRSDASGQESGGSGDVGIDQNGGECILCGVFVLSREQRHDGFGFFDQYDHDKYERRQLSWDRLFGGGTKIYEFIWIGYPERISFWREAEQLFCFDRYGQFGICEPEFGFSDTHKHKCGKFCGGLGFGSDR